MKGTPRRYARRARPDRRLDVEKNSNPPEAGDRPLGGGPGCHIARVGADSRVVRKTPGGRTVVVAGEGSPRWLRWCSCRSRRGVGAQTNRKPPTKARKLESRPDFTREAKECASAESALGFRVSEGVSLNLKNDRPKTSGGEHSSRIAVSAVP